MNKRIRLSWLVVYIILASIIYQAQTKYSIFLSLAIIFLGVSVAFGKKSFKK